MFVASEKDTFEDVLRFLSESGPEDPDFRRKWQYLSQWEDHLPLSDDQRAKAISLLDEKQKLFPKRGA